MHGGIAWGSSRRPGRPGAGGEIMIGGRTSHVVAVPATAATAAGNNGGCDRSE